VLLRANEIVARHLPEAERHPTSGTRSSCAILRRSASGSLQTVPSVSKVGRSGIFTERVFIDYSQERLAHVGVQGSAIALLAARNILMPGDLFISQHLPGITAPASLHPTT
jgi:hypothetical protein